MLLGKITGKATTKKFQFIAKSTVQNLDYLKVYHEAYEYVLCQVVELETTAEHTLATCIIHGHLHNNKLKPIRIPFAIQTEVFAADDEFIQDTLQLTKNNAKIGKLDGHDIPVTLDLNKLLTKHLSVLAKSGAGKSYTVGVLLEEILEHNIPVLIIDPHGEHATLKEPANPTSKQEQERFARYEVEPKGYNVIEYEQDNNPIKLPSTLSRQELEHLLPKLNATQQGLLYQAIRHQENTNFDELLLALEAEESMSKWGLINLIESLRNYQLFSNEYTRPQDLIKSGRASIINLKGYPPELQEIIVYKLAHDLFNLRKQNKIAPFFLVLEEAHNFCPERSFGEAASSKILRTIASEGRKFGLGLGVISQRPARVDKSVLSQCTTQIVLKITNPHDLKAVSNSVEGLTQETEAEIRNLPIGTALITGIVDLPLITTIRPRRTRHGGDAVQLTTTQATPDVNTELLPVILPTTTTKDLELMHDTPINITTILKPALRITATNKQEETITLVLDLTKNELLVDEQGTTKKLPNKLNAQEKKVLTYTRKNHLINPQELGVEQTTIDELQAKGYLKTKDKKNYSLTNIYHLGRLKDAQLTLPVTYEHIQGKKQLKKTEGIPTLQKLKAHLKINNTQECWFVYYHITKKQ